MDLRVDLNIAVNPEQTRHKTQTKQMRSLAQSVSSEGGAGPCKDLASCKGKEVFRRSSLNVVWDNQNE